VWRFGCANLVAHAGSSYDGDSAAITWIGRQMGTRGRVTIVKTNICWHRKSTHQKYEERERERLSSLEDEQDKNSL
jgi:hypothetical protein